MRIYLTGGAAVPNYGDEMIVDSWLRWYVNDNHVSPDNIVVSGSRQGVIEDFFSARFPGLKASHQLYRSRIKYRPASFVEMLQHGYEHLDSRDNLNPELLKELSGTSLFHLHGGGYLNNNWPEQAFHLGIGVWVKERLGAALVGTGLGLGPLPDFKGEELRIVQRMFSQFDTLEVRDQWSYDWLRRHEAHKSAFVGLDDVFLQQARVRKMDASVLHLSFVGKHYADDFAASLANCRLGSFDKVFFWVCTIQDAVTYADVAATFPFVRSVTPVWINSLLAEMPVGTRNFMVTSRFHPHIMAARVGMSGTYMSKSPYYEVKHGSALKLGSAFSRGLDVEIAAKEIDPAAEMVVRDPERIKGKQDFARTFLSAAG